MGGRQPLTAKMLSVLKDIDEESLTADVDQSASAVDDRMGMDPVLPKQVEHEFF